ncbi:MAG: hypothetical protein Q9O74_09085 [Planctomycetota bacterium]|nr:hypothetical protein [Planctomycetota bacterium]
MAIRQSLKTAGQGTVVVVVVLAANGCATGSARTDYFVARSAAHQATQGDGSLVEFTPDATNPTWSASLTYVPILDAGDLADIR